MFVKDNMKKKKLPKNKKAARKIEEAGGSLEIAYALQLHQFTVDRWAWRGIPAEHQAMVDELIRVQKLSIKK